MTEPILWTRSNEGDILYPVPTYHTRVLDTYYRIENDGYQTDGCRWYLWIKERSNDDFQLWGGYRSLTDAKAAVTQMVADETRKVF